MCPFCFTSLGLVVAGAVSSGGLAVLAVKMSGEKNHAPEIDPDANEGSSENVKLHSR
jgi:hypothetical protein